MAEFSQAQQTTLRSQFVRLDDAEWRAMMRFEPTLEYQQLTELLRGRPSARRLLEFAYGLLRAGRLERLGGDQLSFTNWAPAGWRRDILLEDGARVILAREGALLVAIVHGRSVEVSVRDLSDGTAVERGYAGTPAYFGHHTGGTQHVSAMSDEHLSRSSPEMHRIYAYFAGPL